MIELLTVQLKVMGNKCNSFKHGTFIEVALIQHLLSKQNTNRPSWLCVLGSERKSNSIKILMTMQTLHPSNKFIRIVNPTLIGDVVSKVNK